MNPRMTGSANRPCFGRGAGYAAGVERGCRGAPVYDACRGHIRELGIADSLECSAAAHPEHPDGGRVSDSGEQPGDVLERVPLHGTKRSRICSANLLLWRYL